MVLLGLYLLMEMIILTKGWWIITSTLIVVVAQFSTTRVRKRTSNLDDIQVTLLLCSFVVPLAVMTYTPHNFMLITVDRRMAVSILVVLIVSVHNV